MMLTFKQILKQYTLLRNLNFSRSIMFSYIRTEKVVEELKKNPYFEKYAQKIATLQQTSPEEFLSRIETRVYANNKPKIEQPMERQYSRLLQPKENITGATDHADKSLNDIMKVGLIKDKEANEIKLIWEKYHIQRDVIAATIPSNVYEKIVTRSKAYPTFIFPLPRNQGYEFIMCQFQRDTVHFTPLIYYQVHKDNAPECLTMIHYTEFKDDKNIVLMKGEFDKDVINAKEAQCLANQLQMYYGQDDKHKLNFLNVFTNEPDKFKHMELISELENLSL